MLSLFQVCFLGIRPYQIHAAVFLPLALPTFSCSVHRVEDVRVFCIAFFDWRKVLQTLYRHGSNIRNSIFQRSQFEAWLMMFKVALETCTCDSQKDLSLLLFHLPILFLVVCTLHSSALCTSYSSRSFPGLSAPPPPSPSPPSLVCLCLSLPSAAVTRFKVTSSHHLLGSPSVLTYFYWLMHCSPHTNTHSYRTMGTNTRTHIGYEVIAKQ